MRRCVFWFFLIPAFFLRPAGGAECTFADLETTAVHHQAVLYAGDFDAAARLWRETVRARPCPLARGYLADVWFWRWMKEKVNDEVRPETTRGFLAVVEALAREAETRRPREVAEPADAFAYGWAYALKAQWNGFRHRWFSLAGDIKNARKWFLRAYALAPNRGEILYQMGLFQYMLDRHGTLFTLVRWLLGVPAGNKAEAWPLLERAAEQPGGLQPEIWMVLGALYQQEGRWLDTLRMIRRIRAAYPGNPLFHLWEGLFYERVAVDYEQAFRVYQAVLARSRSGMPRYDDWVAAQALYRMGHAAYKMYRFDTARRIFRELIDWGPRTPPWVMPKTFLVLGDLERDSGDLTAARRAYARVMQFPPVLDYRRRAAQALHRDYDTEEWRDLQRYVRSKVDLAEHRVERGCSGFREALKLKGTPLVRLGIAECELARGRRAKARLWLQRLLRVSRGVNLARAQAKAALLLANLTYDDHGRRSALQYYRAASRWTDAPDEVVQRAAYRIKLIMMSGG